MCTVHIVSHPMLTACFSWRFTIGRWHLIAWWSGCRIARRSAGGGWRSLNRVVLRTRIYLRTASRSPLSSTRRAAQQMDQTTYVLAVLFLSIVVHWPETIRSWIVMLMYNIFFTAKSEMSTRWMDALFTKSSNDDIIYYIATSIRIFIYCI